MELKIGESKTFKLPFWLKAIDVACEKNGLRLERKSGNAILYVNNGSRFNTYAGVPLGPWWWITRKLSHSYSPPQRSRKEPATPPRQARTL